MKFIDALCPRCGATLSVDVTDDNATCKYCGANLFASDESRSCEATNVERDGRNMAVKRNLPPDEPFVDAHPPKAVKRTWTRLASVLVVLLGLALIVYPLVGDYLNNLHASEVHTRYDDRVSQMDRSAIDAEMARAEEYNKILATNQYTIVDPYGDTSYDSELYQDYASTLNIDDKGTMAYLEIPCINVFLPVYHGTSEEVLEAGIGHIQQTSLPVGGPSTHAVLTGHTGLSAAKLFTDVDKMVEGDIFFLHVYDQTLAYEVDEINIVTPDDTSKLQIIDGEDHVTLITCYPYGKNTHRLLVRGTRTEYTSAVQTARQQENEGRRSTRYEHYFRGLGISIIAVLPPLLYVLAARKKKEKKLHNGYITTTHKLTGGN